MAIKKSNVISVNLTDKNLLFMQHLGYLNKKKKSTQKLNISEFINRCIDFFIGIKWSHEEQNVELKLLLSRMSFLDKKRKHFNSLIEKDIKEVAIAINKIQSSKPIIESESVEIKEDPALEVLERDAYVSPIDTPMLQTVTHR